MNNTIVGSLPIEHSVDPNGSLAVNVPIRVPPAKLSPDISISYHSAVHELSVLGHGWDLHAFGLVQRTGATIAQDNVATNGTVNYDSNDRYTLNGQRLMHVSGNEYRFEIEQWSKVEAIGDNPANPTSWKEYLPNGTVRLYGSTKDSNLLAQLEGGGTATRIWALAENYDHFSNYTSYTYMQADGFLSIDSISYGGNRALPIKHQRKITFAYENRQDIQTEFVGGSRVCLKKRLASISASFDDKRLHTYTFSFDYAPVTGFTRLQAVTLSDASDASDAPDASVSPLKFKWSDSAPSVFNNLVTLDPIDLDMSDVQVFPADVNGSGRSDLILASKQYDDKTMDYVLCVDVHIADGKGGFLTTPQPGPVPTGLSYPDFIRLLALDVDGDGRTDLLHIVKDENNHVLTVLLSKESGYEPQLKHQTTFSPGVPDGTYYSGDFQGNGNVGIVYLYNDGADVRLVQFTSQENSFLQRPVEHGPSFVDLSQAQVIIADFNGNGASDIFIISARWDDENAKKVCEIDFFESQNGYLKFRDDNPFAKTGASVPWTEETLFLALPERDGKVGLLLLSKSSDGFLEFQTLRSTGKSFYVSDLTTTKLSYSGNINIGHTASLNSLDLISTFEEISSTDVSALHFINDTFCPIPNVAQPGPSLKGCAVHFADLRGIGRADCLFSIYNQPEKKLELHSFRCAGAVESPADFIIGYTSGLGATTSVSYAPLTDSTVYASIPDSRAAQPYINALSRTSSSQLRINPSNEQSSAPGGAVRTQLVHFPKFVVKELISCALPSLHPEIVSKAGYYYTNGRLAFDGRGWLGFHTISQTSHGQGTVTKNTYGQQFPFVGQVVKTEMEDTSGKKLKSVTNEWKQHPATQNSTRCYVTLPRIQQTSYENGSPSYSVDITHDYDSYANVTETKITIAGKPSLVTTCTYDNDIDADKWIIGSKRTESIISDNHLIKASKFAYRPGTQVVNQIGEWVSESYYSMQDLSFDDTGNVKKAIGPERAQKTLVYDPTYSFPITVTSSVDDQSSLTTSTSYDFALGQPTSVTEYNGHIKTQRYDVLGRLTEVKEGDNLNNMTVVEKQNYSLLDGFAVRVRETLSDPASWSRETEYLDGMGRTWKKAVPCASDSSVTVFGEVLLDGVGRTVREYRNYTNKTSKPVYSTYSYDSLSRKTEIISPPAISGVDPVKITYQYGYSTGQTTITQTKSGGGQATAATQTVLEYFPNTDTTSGQFVVPLTISSKDELGHIVKTSYDALHRAVSVTDPSGVSLSQKFDGISRQTSRKISNPAEMNPSSINEFSIEYDDTSGQTTITNELTKSKTILLKDRLHRVVKRTTSDETVTMTWDDARVGAQGNLSLVKYSNGMSESFSYDKRGCMQSSTLTIDNQTFTTTFEYNAGRHLKKITNPDGSVVTKTFFQNSNTVKQAQLRDAGSTNNVSSTFSDFGNPFSSPLVCDMGNGLKSQVTIADNGVPVKAVLLKGKTILHQQTWTLNGYGRLDACNPSSSEDTNRIYQYSGGQLMSSESKSDAQSSIYSYDTSGNILSKDGNTYSNHGWQLSSIADSSNNLLRSFEYTADGNLKTEKDGSGTVRTMTYDSVGRMTSVNSTTFVYDYQGRMIKATSGNGSVTYYPSESYEVTMKDGNTTHTAYLVHQARRGSISTAIDSEKSSHTSVLYYHGDHLGSVVAVSDGHGNIVTTYSYDDYGVPTWSNSDNSRYKYSGKEMFEGLYYFGARFYDPATGRFTSLDNITFPLNDITPSIFNQYAFSRNNPVNFIDVNGNMPFWWHMLWHLVVDVALIVGGLALGTVGGFLGVPLLVGEAMVGAGISGLVSDAGALVNGKVNDTAWAVSLGVGAAFSLTGLGISTVAGKAGYASIEAADVLGTRAASKWITSAVTDVARRQAVQLTLSSINGIAQSITSTTLTNVLMGKDPMDGVGVSTVVFGALGGLAGGVWSRGGVKAVGKAEIKAKWTGDKYFYNVMRDAKSVPKTLELKIGPIDNKGIKLISRRLLDEDVGEHLNPFPYHSPANSVLSGQSNFF